MSYALGQPVVLQQLVHGSTGALANASTAALTITLPGGTTVTPTVTNPPATTGTYVCTYVPPSVGLYVVRWLFNAPDYAPPVDSIYVEASDVPPLISLVETRRQCRGASTADDDELHWHALVASEICEDRTQIWRRRAITAVFDGRGQEFLRLRAPVASVTSVVEDGVTLSSTGWTLNAAQGWLYRGGTTASDRWAVGRQNITVTDVAGPSDGVVPANIRQGVRLLTQHLWDSQRGGASLPRQAGADYTTDVRTGFSIPNRVLELWKTEMPGVLVG